MPAVMRPVWLSLVSALIGVLLCCRPVFAQGAQGAQGTQAPPASPPPPAAAPADTEPAEDLDQVVQRTARHGEELLQQGRPAEALREFQAAYELDAQPLFLFQIAESLRQAGKPREALRAYDRFLREDKDGRSPQRPAAERHMKELYAQLRAQEERRDPVYKKAWFWGVVGGAVVVVGVGLGVGLALGLRSGNAIE